MAKCDFLPLSSTCVPGIKETVVLGSIVLTMMSLLSVGLGKSWRSGATATGEPVAGRRDAASFGTLDAVRPQGPSAATMAGRWTREGTGSGLIITTRGEVWSDSGTMQGMVLPNRAGATFVFGTPAFFCAYDLAFKDSGTVNLRLVDQTPGTPCPSGWFRKPSSL